MPGQRGPVPVPLQDGQTDVTQNILNTLNTHGGPLIASENFPKIPRNEIKAALDRLGSRSMVEYKAKDTEVIKLTPEGEEICDEGSHEWKVWHAVQEKGKLEMKDLAVSHWRSRGPARMQINLGHLLLIH